MNFYILLAVFLYIGECNARVVPMNFKLDESKTVDASNSENELVDESLLDEEEIFGHSLPDDKKRNDLELLIFEDRNTSVVEVSSRNASNFPVDLASEVKDIDKESNLESTEDLASEEKNMDEEPNLKSAEDLATSNLPDDEFNSSAEFISKNDSDSKELLETLQINGTRSDVTIENLTVKNETFIKNNSSSDDLEQESNFEFAEIGEKTLNETLEPRNEISAVLEVFNGTNNTSNSLEFRPLSNDTEVEVFLRDAENITEEFKSNNLTVENLDVTNDSVKTEGAIFSGFEFLINSEVARNAAKAMEIFNFSDPLTDHIMEENEFHSFLPAFNAEHDLDSPNLTDLKSEIFNANSSEESNEIRADLNTSLPSGEEISLMLNQTRPEGISTVLNQTDTLEIKKNSSMPFNINEPLVDRQEDNTEFLILAEELEGNETSEVSSPLGNTEETIQFVSETRTATENINDVISNSSTVDVPECPPPGWCIFWFLSQDACAVNEHCLGSRICCKISCSKTCIEVESS